MTYKSLDQLRKDAKLKTVYKEQVHHASYLITGIARILEDVFAVNTPGSSAHTFAKFYKDYMTNPVLLLEEPIKLSISINKFNEEIGCAIKEKNSGVNAITIKAFKQIIEKNDNAISDLIRMCENVIISSANSLTYCTKDFINDIENHFLPLAAQCNTHDEL